MGYTIRIGQAIPRDDPDWHEYGWKVEPVELAEAPAAPGDTNPHSNLRWPSYSVWTDFTKETGLHHLFYVDSGDDEGLIHPHPGVVVLREAHGLVIRAALSAYRQRFPEAIARFDVHPAATPLAEQMLAAQQFPTCDYQLARLEWLSWWVDWALANCSRPAIENS